VRLLPSDLYLLARLSVQEAADGESLDDQVRQGKRDAAEVLGIEQEKVAFVETNPDAIHELTGCWIASSGGSSVRSGYDEAVPPGASSPGVLRPS